MGFGIIDIRKVAVHGSLVTYEYVHDRRDSGRFTIHTETGEFTDAQMAPGRAGQSAHFAARHKVTVAWREGSLPDELQWAG